MIPSAPVTALSLLLMGATAVPLIYRRLSGSLDLFEPIALISAVFALNFSVRALFLVEDSAAVPRLGLYPYDDVLARALAYSFAGFAALAAGYVAAGWILRRVERPRFRSWPETAPIGKIVLIAVVGTLATVAMVAGGRVVDGAFTTAPVGDSTFVLQALSQFINFSAAIAAIYLAGARKGGGRRWLLVWLLAVLLAVSALQAFVFGSKSRLLITVFVIVGAFNYAGRRRVRLMTAGAMALAVLFVVFPAVNAYRTGEFRIGATRSAGAFVASLKDLGGFLLKGGLTTDFHLAIDSIVQRSHGVDSLSLLIKYGDHTDLAHGRDYLLVPAYAFVPRAIWPSKPINTTGRRFMRAFIVAPDNTSYVEGSVTLGIFHVGDLYICFGVIGMIAGLFILGAIYRGLYWRYNPTDSANRRGIFMFVVLLWLVINGFESDVPTVYANILKMMVILWVVGVFVAGARPAGPQPAR